MRRVLELKEGTMRVRGVTEVERIWAFRPVPGTDWTALSGIPTELVFAPMRARTLRSALLLAVALGAALGLALLAARRLTRPVHAIAEAVRARAAGRDSLRVPVSGPREIAAVATELNRSIDERERAERTLRESEERFRALWETSADAILMLDEESIIRYANPAVLEVFGYRPEELQGRELALLQPAALAAGHREGFARYLRTGSRKLDWRSTLTAARRKDGAEFPVEVSFSELRLGGQRYFAGFLSDVSDRMRAEKRLEMTQRLFTALSEVNETIVRVRERDELFHELCRIAVERLDFLLASVALVDAARQAVVPHIYAGPASGVLRDCRFPLDPAQPLASTVTSSAVRTRRAAVANDVEADPTKAAARQLRQRTGAKSTAAFPLFQGGEVIGALTVHAAARNFFDAPVVELLTRMADDISFALDKLDEHDKLAELTRGLEERVQRRTAELEAANQELEAFSYSVSHDLRAPVRHVDGFAQLLEKELKAPGAKAAHYLATIAAAARRMGALIDDLLQLSRTGRQVLGRRHVDTGALVRALIHEAMPELAQRKVEWQVGELPAVMADPALLRIVLQNLLSNAMKYSRPRPVARIAVSARAAGDGATVEISVRDNGVGFDPRFKDKLFGVFQRLHREEEFEGTGIGLATARRIVHRHGQRIWGEGMPGEGATFSFTMALAQEEVADESGTHTAG
jgi:PAS domain S-box-containing protein